MTRDWRRNDGGATAGNSSAGPLGTPGKQTLTERLPVPGRVEPAPGDLAPGKQTLAESLPAAQNQPGATVVQRKADDKARTNPEFVNDNANRLIIAIMDRIAAVPLLQPHPRLRWRREDHAKEALGLAISHYIKAAPDIVLKRMMMLSYPADLFALVDDARRGPEGSRLEAVKLAIAVAFDEPVMASIRRMGARACVQLDLAAGKPVPASSLVASCPLDGIMADLLVNPERIDHHPQNHGAPDDTAGRPFAGGARTIQFEWQGARDPDLWNVIKVTAPADATVEDVAQHAFVGDEVAGSEQAYRIAASPPFFGIPFETARLVKEARTYAPDSVKAKLDTGPGPRIADPTALEQSAISDEAALAQAPGPNKGDLPPNQSLDRAHLQLAFLQKQLEPWHATGPLAGAIAFVERRRAEFGSDPRTAHRWATALAAQERALHAASSEVEEVLGEVTSAGARPQDTAGASGLGPVKQVLAAYARAAGVSHLHVEAPAALAAARRLRTMLPLALAEDRVRTARGAVADQRAAEAGTETLEPNAAKTPQDVNGQMQRAADLRLQAARGEKLAPDAVEQLNVDASETELRARLVTLATQAHNVMRKADEVGLDKARSPSGAWSVHMIAELILQKVNGPSGLPPADKNDRSGGGWHAQLDAAAHYTGPQNGMTGDQALIARRRDAIKHVTTDMMTFATTLGVGGWLKDAYDQIKDQQLRNMIWNMALQIGITLATGQLLGAAGAAIRGLSLAGEIGAELRGTSLLYQGAELVAQAGANTAIQGALGGPIGARELAENALGIVLTSAALRPFHGLLHDSAAVEQDIRTWGQLARRGGKLAADLVIDTGASIGAAGVAHAVTHGGDMDQGGAEAWVTMGLSIAASKFVHERTQRMQHRIVEAARELKTSSFDKLLDKVTALEQRSHLKDQHPTPEQTIELLTERHKLLVEERTLYEGTPTARKALTETKADLAATGAQFAEVPLQLAHLNPVVDGHIYEGTSAEIEQAFHVADATGVPLQREWLPDEHMWRVTSGERVIEIHEQRSRAERPALHAAADRVPHSGFSGDGGARHDGKANFELHEVHTGAQRAADTLNGSHGATQAYTPRADGAVVITSGTEQVTVKFAISSKPTPQVAEYSFKPGQKEVTVTLSPEARPQDISRAVAHELAEILALLERPSRSTNVSLEHGSKATNEAQLSHHDLGRKAELQVLLRELDVVRTPADQTAITNEIDALLRHMGFDPHTVRTDPRAQTILGVELQTMLGARFSSGRLGAYAGATHDLAELHRFTTQIDPALVQALEAKLPATRIVEIWRASQAHGVEQFHRVMALETAGRIRGLDDWVKFTFDESNKTGADLRNAIGELSEAQSLARENPKCIVNVGGDARAPIRAPIPGASPQAQLEKMRTFDITVETPAGIIERSVEVTGVKDPVTTTKDLSEGLGHAAAKVRSRITDNAPLPGPASTPPATREASIAFEFDTAPQVNPEDKSTTTIDPHTGMITKHLAGGRPPIVENFYDQRVVQWLNKSPNGQDLDVVRLIGRDGAMRAVFTKQGVTWSRTR